MIARRSEGPAKHRQSYCFSCLLPESLVLARSAARHGVALAPTSHSHSIPRVKCERLLQVPRPGPATLRRRSSRCWANSSTISASRRGASFSPASRCLISSCHSGTIYFPSDRIDAGHSVQCEKEVFPGLPLLGQYLLSSGC